jgi:hypothetical protein
VGVDRIGQRVSPAGGTVIRLPTAARSSVGPVRPRSGRGGQR